MSIFTNIFHALGVAGSAVGHFFAGAFKWVETDGAKVALAILEDYKTAASSGMIDFFAKIADGLTKTNVPTEIVTKINAALPNLMADALGLQALGTNPTDEQIQALSQQILTEWGMLDNKSKFYSVVGADIIGIIRKDTQPGVVFNFAMATTDLKTVYDDYQAALAQENGTAAAPAGTAASLAS